MNFEFLIAYHSTDYIDIENVLLERLVEVLEANVNEFDPSMVQGMIQLQHVRTGIESSNENGEKIRQTLLGFALDLPEEIEQMQVIVSKYSAILSETSPIFHVVKFEDPVLRGELLKWSSEIFALEMKLRRVLTFIYLYATQASEPYDLLQDETVQPMSKERPTLAQMKAATENQFFHLVFSQYATLNRRPELKLPDLLATIRDEIRYEAFRDEILRTPVQHEDDAVLLAGLKERMDAIEKMRNCIAHNRRPSRHVIENYENARPSLDEMLDNYLSQWEVDLEDDEMPWDTSAREAVESALENAYWDDESKTITLFDASDDRQRTMISSREDLEQALSDIAAEAFYANAPRDDGEFVFECDEYGIVESALSKYEDRLDTFFNTDNSDEIE